MAEFTKPDKVNLVWADTGEKTTPTDGKISNGWTKEIPTFQQFNWVNNKQDLFAAYVNQHGICQWDTDTEYRALKSYVQGSNGNIYLAKSTNTGQNPVTDTSYTYWGLAFIAGQYALPVVNITPANSWVAPVATDFSASVNDGTIKLYAYLNGGTTTNGTSIGTLAVGYRPSVTKIISGVFYTGAAYTPCEITINTSGTITINGVTANNRLYISATIPM